MEPVEYEVAHEFAQRNHRKIISFLPRELQLKEDRFLEKLGRIKTGPLKKLERLYSLMDELSEAMAPFMPCRRGCSACCHYNVDISEIEIAYIEKHTKYRSNKTPAPKQNFHSHPCPFLRDGTCSIYKARPFFCRRHNALTPNAYWCHHSRSNEKSFPMIGFTNVDRAFNEIRSEANCRKPNDIRQHFAQKNNP